jgi:hypothetical protein
MSYGSRGYDPYSGPPYYPVRQYPLPRHIIPPVTAYSRMYHQQNPLGRPGRIDPDRPGYFTISGRPEPNYFSSAPYGLTDYFYSGTSHPPQYGSGKRRKVRRR